LSSPKISGAPPMWRAAMNNETVAPLIEIRNLRCCAGLPARATSASRPDVYASAPQCTVGAHEKNARKCNSRGRVARRSG
jgi:hypothetical protein